jgi:hypothetical protein
MRALFYIPVLCLAGATAFPQALPRVSPSASSVCSIPLLRFVPPDIDPLISKKLPEASDRKSQARAPAPPCDEPAAQPPVLARNLDRAAKGLLERFLSSRKPSSITGRSDPVPYVSVPLPSELK